MSQSQKVFEEYLRRLGLLSPAHLGPRKPQDMRAAAEENEWLATQLEKGARFNRQLVMVMVVLLCLLFGAGVALGFYLLKSPGFIGLSLAALLAFLLRVIAQLRRLWWDQNRMTLASLIAREFRPEDVVEIVKVLYWSSDKPSAPFDFLTGKKSDAVTQSKTIDGPN